MASYGFQLALLGWAVASPVFSAGQAEGSPPAVVEAPESIASPVASDSPPQPPCCLIPAGTVIVVELTEALSAKSAKAGDRFGLRLAEPITVSGNLMAPAGTEGFGEVIDAKPAGIGGRPGRLVLAARYLERGEQRLKLQSLKLGGGGRDNSSLAVGAVIAVGVVGALVPGGGVEYPAGTRATAKIASDITVPPAEGVSAPLPAPLSTP